MNYLQIRLLNPRTLWALRKKFKMTIKKISEATGLGITQIYERLKEYGIMRKK